MKPGTNAKSEPYKGSGNVIKHSPVNDNKDGSVSTVRKK